MSTQVFSSRAARCRILPALLLGVASLLATCRQLTPEEQLEVVRSRYTAQLTGFVVEGGPQSEPLDEPEGEETSEEPGDAPEPIVPLTSNIVFDILVRTESVEKLEGVTLDVYHADAEEQEKAHHRIWVDVSGVERGPGTQITYVLEGVEYEKGDRFFIELRRPSPEEKQHYREYHNL